jgi:hypothetical protein
MKDFKKWKGKGIQKQIEEGGHFAVNRQYGQGNGSRQWEAPWIIEPLLLFTRSYGVPFFMNENY